MPDLGVTEKKQEFELHMTMLTDTQKLLLENTGKVAGFLLLALGWLATSTGARNYLTHNHLVAMVFVVAFCVAYSMAAAFMWSAYRGCDKTYQRLLELAFVPERAYEVRKPRPLVFAGCIVGSGFLLAPLVVVIIVLIS